jgi:hypothetical protein
MPDTQASTELKLFIDNDGDLYRRMTTSILKNLAAKKARGVYRHDLADRVEILESGGSKYFKPGQFGYVVGESSRGGMFTLDRGDSRQGDLTYLVSKKPKGAGGSALWFSPEALRFTGRGGGVVSGGTTKNRTQIAREVEAVVGKVPSCRGR